MLKKTIRFTDFNNREREEEFYFHLSQPRIIRWSMQHVKDNGLEGYFMRLVKEEDGEGMFAFIEKMVLDSYGKKTEDGGFLQTDELRSSFESSPAYAKLLMEMIKDADEATAFLNGIIPQGFSEEVAVLELELQTRAPNRAERRHPSMPLGPRPEAAGTQSMRVPEPGALLEEPKILTKQEIEEMDAVDLQEGLKTGRYKLS